jgi:hypothetical protein
LFQISSGKGGFYAWYRRNPGKETGGGGTGFKSGKAEEAQAAAARQKNAFEKKARGRPKRRAAVKEAEMAPGEREEKNPRRTFQKEKKEARTGCACTRRRAVSFGA